MIKKRYKMFDVGSPYLTRCGVKSDDDYFENMTECCEEMNRLSEENEELKEENRKLKEDLEHCANQFTNDGKNVLLSLR